MKTKPVPHVVARESYKETIREETTGWFDRNGKKTNFDNGDAATCLRQLADELDEIHREQEGQ